VRIVVGIVMSIVVSIVVPKSRETARYLSVPCCQKFFSIVLAVNVKSRWIPMCTKVLCKTVSIYDLLLIHVYGYDYKEGPISSRD
jgi:hypothetical protein